MATLFPFVDEDPNNAAQSVTAVTGHTEATAPDGGDTLSSLGTVTLTDKVFYSGLIIGKEYTVTGTLYVRPKNATGTEKYTNEELKGMRLLDKNGDPILASRTFTATESTGYIDVEFTFDASILQMKATTIVCFEEMKVLPENVTVFTHADIFDEPQTLYVPAISTTAKSIDDREEKLMAFDDGNFVDTVAYENLAPHTEYTLTGVVMDKDTGKALVLNGKTLEEEVTFTTGAANRPDGHVDGTQDVEFTITEDQFEDLKGKHIVIFESLFNMAGKELAHHTDLDDKGQELYVPEIHTELTDDVTGTHIAYPDEEVHFTDVVTYKNLIPGKEYRMEGILYDKETGEPLHDENGNEIKGSEPFTAGETGAGTVEVHFTFNAKLLMVEGKSFVVFEDCYTLPGMRRIATHADLNDEMQEVDFPKVGTTAGSTSENGKVTVTDEIAYENLIPGLTYVAYGTLMKPDGTVATDADTKEAVTVRYEFVAEKTDGTVKVTFPAFVPEWNLDSDVTVGDTNTKKYSYRYVVFEEVYVVKDGAEHMIGEHKELTDGKQTVSGERPETTTLDRRQPTTGDSTPIVWFSMLFLVSAAGIALILWRKRKNQ